MDRLGSIRLMTNAGGTSIFWNGASFGATQEAEVTLVEINPAASEIDLVLKSQSSTTYQDGVLEVWYDPGAQHVQVVTYDAGQGWVQQSANITVTLASGDRFGARARADGIVEVYRNDTLLAMRDVSACVGLCQPIRPIASSTRAGSHTRGTTIPLRFATGTSWQPHERRQRQLSV